MTKIKQFSFVHAVLCDAQQSLCLSFDPGTGSDLSLLDLSLSPQLSAPGVAASPGGGVHESAGGQPGVAFGDGEWSPGAAGTTCAGRSVAAGFLQSVRSELLSIWDAFSFFIQVVLS